MTLKNNIITVVLTGIMLVLIMSLHLVYVAYWCSETGYMWFFGVKIHGSIIIDLIIWSMLIIQFIIMIMVLMNNDS